jgi:hypothetical protein
MKIELVVISISLLAPEVKINSSDLRLILLRTEGHGLEILGRMSFLIEKMLLRDNQRPLNLLELSLLRIFLGFLVMECLKLSYVIRTFFTGLSC